MGCINSKNLEDPTGTAAPIPPQSPAAANNTNNESPYLNQASIYAEPIEAQVVVDDTNKKKKKKGGGGIFSYPGAKQQVKQPYTPNQSEFNNFVNTTGGGNSPLLVDNPVVTKHFVKAPGGGNALVLVDDNSAPSSSPPVQCFDTINNPLSSYSSPLPSSSYQQLPPPSQTTGSTFIEVIVPEGVKAGQVINVSSGEDNKLYECTVPDGMTPGSKFFIEVQDTPPVVTAAVAY